MERENEGRIRRKSRKIAITGGRSFFFLMNELQGRLVITDVRVDMEINASTFEDLRRFGMVARGVRAFSNIAKLKLKLIDKFSVRKQLSIFESLQKYISRK